MSEHERRVHPRTRTTLTATLLAGRDSVEGAIENIGQGGVFFATEDLEVLVDDETPVRLVFTCRRSGVPEDHDVKGVVLRSERYFDGNHVVRAFAIKFEGSFDLDGVELG